MNSFRIESDSIGSKEIPKDAYYGVQSLRGAENFKITGQRMKPEFIVSLAEIKKAAALCNNKAGELDSDRMNAICTACDEIIGGKFHDQFICDPIQGGAGTTANMNANEVIANRAIEILGGEKGDYSVVHPNDHVNRGQSTNDVIPSAAKMTAIKLLRRAANEVKKLEAALAVKEEEFKDVIKMGRTQLQDAVPITLGREFGAYRRAIKRDVSRLLRAMEEMYTLNMGGTAVGTALNASGLFVEEIAAKIAEISGLPVRKAEDLVDGTQNLDSFAYVSGALKNCAISCSKIANDLRLMSAGPRCGLSEINLPAMQNGSSIMPGKVNPVIPEVMSQAAFCIIGNDVAITMAAEAGQLELNFAEPVLYHKLFESICALEGAVNTFTVNCIEGITANAERCLDYVEHSVGIITAVCPKLGYKASADIAKKAISTGASVREVLRNNSKLSEDEISKLLDPHSMI